MARSTWHSEIKGEPSEICTKVFLKQLLKRFFFACFHNTMIKFYILKGLFSLILIWFCSRERIYHVPSMEPLWDQEQIFYGASKAQGNLQHRALLLRTDSSYSKLHIFLCIEGFFFCSFAALFDYLTSRHLILFILPPLLIFTSERQIKTAVKNKWHSFACYQIS